MDTLYTDSGKIMKMEVDYSSTVEEKIPVCEELTKVIKLLTHIIIG